MLGDEEAKDPGICEAPSLLGGRRRGGIFSQEYESSPTFLTECPAILIFGPMPGGGGLALQIQDGGNVGDDSAADVHGNFESGVVSARS
jgi:hypothetical protein